MSQGRIEQVGTPEEIYQDPASAFVADFVGEMNFIPAEIVDDNRVRIGRIDFDADTSGLKDRAVLAAVRPEDIIISAADSHPNNFRALMEEGEFLGSFFRARLGGGDLGANSLRADVAMHDIRNMKLRPGAEMPVAIPRERIRVYAQAA